MHYISERGVPFQLYNLRPSWIEACPFVVALPGLLERMCEQDDDLFGSTVVQVPVDHIAIAYSNSH